MFHTSVYKAVALSCSSDFSSQSLPVCCMQLKTLNWPVVKRETFPCLSSSSYPKERAGFSYQLYFTVSNSYCFNLFVGFCCQSNIHLFFGQKCSGPDLNTLLQIIIIKSTGTNCGNNVWLKKGHE